MKKETKNEKSMFKMSIVKRGAVILICLIASIFMFSCVDSSAQTLSEQHMKIMDSLMIEQVIDSPIPQNYVLPHDSIRSKMIAEANVYLAKNTRGKHDPKLAEYLVDNALEHNIDLCFMMSQTKIETCFGTAGAGRPSSRRSLFGVVKRKYSNYDDAIDDYCKLLKKSYLVRGRTEQDLMKRYVTGSGYRYAGSLTYERDLTKAYKEIKNQTNLSELQRQYKIEYTNYLASLSNNVEREDSTNIS